jgi:hypothetical protein
LPLAPPIAAPDPGRPADGPTFSEVLPAFLDLMHKNEGWTGQTLAQNKTTYRMAIEWCGDLPVRQYTRRHFAGFYDMLRDDQREIVLGTKGKQRGKQQADASLRDTENVPLSEEVAEYTHCIKELHAYPPNRGENPKAPRRGCGKGHRTGCCPRTSSSLEAGQREDDLSIVKPSILDHLRSDGSRS